MRPPGLIDNDPARHIPARRGISMGRDQFFLLHVSAEDDPRRYQRHLFGQAAALTDFSVRVRPQPWTKSRAAVSIVQCIDAETGAIAGGVSVHARHTGEPLPTEANLEDNALSAEIAAYPERDVCEMCGMWIAKAYRGRGLFDALFRGAVAAAALRGAKRTISSAHDKSARLAARLGMRIDYQRPFAWPSEQYRTFVGRFDLERLDEMPGAETTRAMIVAFAAHAPYTQFLPAALRLPARRSPRRARLAVAVAGGA
jgi:hypothetical protein